MLAMHPPDGAAAGQTNTSRYSYNFSKSSVDHTGFSHGAYHSNSHSLGGYGDRNGRRPNIPSINTGPLGRTLPVTTSLGLENTLTSPSNGFDMQMTPLLPQGLLLGSPYHPGSPSNYASPQFPNFAGFTQASAAPQQALTAASNGNSSGTVSPPLYQGIMPGSGFGNASMFMPQSPTTGFSSLSAAVSVPPGMAAGLISATSRTVYLGNIPADTSAEEILGHVRSGQIESVRLLPDKNCAFISFLDGSSATHFHSDAILKKLAIRGQDIKVGWGKPSQVPTSVALAVQQSGASRNVYLGNIPEEVTEQELREELGKFGPIDTVKIVREKSIGFVHFLSISNAIKAVTQLPQEAQWGPPRRVYYGKDRCAYVSKTQQQNAAQYLGIAPGYAHILNSADRDLISSALAQQSVAAAAVATTAGGLNNLGNRTVYLGNIHPETTIEEICNVVRGGLLHHIRYIPDKHICFVTFIDPTSAASFYALSNLQGLMIHNRRLKIGWGKHSGALPPAIALAVSGGASRNVYIGNLDEMWTEERLRQDFSEYGEIELVNTLREKSCAFVNFTNIANAIKAIEAVRSRPEYRRFKINFGKDRCGNPPRQMPNSNNQQGAATTASSERNGSPTLLDPNSLSVPNGATSPAGSSISPAPGSTGTPSTSGQTNGQLQSQLTASSILNAGANNPLTMYLNQISQQQQQQQQATQPQQPGQQASADPYSFVTLQQQQQQALAAQQAALYGSLGSAGDLLAGSALENQQINGLSSNLQTLGLNIDHANLNGSNSNGQSSSSLTVPRSQHSRAVSLPVFPQGSGSQSVASLTVSHIAQQQQQQQQQQNGLLSLQSQQQATPLAMFQSPHLSHYGGYGHSGAGAAFASMNGFAGMGSGGYGLAIQSDAPLNGWVEEEIGAQ